MDQGLLVDLYKFCIVQNVVSQPICGKQKFLQLRCRLWSSQLTQDLYAAFAVTNPFTCNIFFRHHVVEYVTNVGFSEFSLTPLVSYLYNTMSNISSSCASVLKYPRTSCSHTCTPLPAQYNILCCLYPKVTANKNGNNPESNIKFDPSKFSITTSRYHIGHVIGTITALIARKSTEIQYSPTCSSPLYEKYPPPIAHLDTILKIVFH